MLCALRANIDSPLVTEPVTSTTRNLQFTPRFASWMEEMEKRSDRHIRDLVAHTRA
jgi:hypothetical protein